MFECRRTVAAAFILAETRVFGILLLLFILLPVAELMLLIRLGGWLGVVPTVGLVLLTGVVGAALARSQGMRVIGGLRAEMGAGRLPVTHMLDGALVLVAGLMLITPGVITDVVGLLLLFPPTRALARRLFAARLRRMVQTGSARVVTFDLGATRAPDADRPAPRGPGRDVSDMAEPRADPPLPRGRAIDQ
jgi:UPF0716 protein FxsA